MAGSPATPVTATYPCVSRSMPATPKKAALEEPNDSIHAYFDRMSSLYRESAGSAGTEATELRQGRGDRLAELTFERMLETQGRLRFRRRAD